jgi:hypothetical protein
MSAFGRRSRSESAKYSVARIFSPLGRKIAGRRKDGFVLIHRLEQFEAAAFDNVQELAQERLTRPASA